MSQQHPGHYEQSMEVAASRDAVFDFIDDHHRFSSHMAKSSWMMAGSSMTTELDAQQGQSVGSHIRMRGRMLGLELSLDEVVTVRERPVRKEWETVGTPRLVVMTWYRMGVHLTPAVDGTRVVVFIDYKQPENGLTAVVGKMFAGPYAKWCVSQMVNGVAAEFSKGSGK